MNKAKDLLTYLYTLEEGNYDIKNGMVFNNGQLLNDKSFVNGSGSALIDKYGNVKFLIEEESKCISKTSLGSIKINRGKCGNYKEIEVELIRNNSKVSFILNNSNLEYKISSSDNFKGEWIINNKDNLVLDTYNEGDNYIWFKDKEGNISEVKSFNVDCLKASNVKYNNSLFYCSGSTVTIDDTKWIVLEDKNSFIKLMKYLPIEEKLNHCFNEKSEYCYYTNESKMPYKWSNSYINYYLNNIYINELSKELKDNIITNYICDEYNNYTCNDEICGGYSKEEIINNDWKCTNYISSKIKIISYDEYNKAYIKSYNQKTLSGNYWAINSYINDKGSSVNNYEFYILEDYTNMLDVKPVILVKK